MATFCSGTGRRTSLFRLGLSGGRVSCFNRPANGLPPCLRNSAFFPRCVSRSNGCLVSIEARPLGRRLGPTLVMIGLGW